MPNQKRPPDITSSDATCFASTTGLRCGMMMIPVASAIFFVSAATNGRCTSGSTIGVSGRTGEGGTWGDGSTTCSPAHHES